MYIDLFYHILRQKVSHFEKKITLNSVRKCSNEKYIIYTLTAIYLHYILFWGLVEGMNVDNNRFFKIFLGGDFYKVFPIVYLSFRVYELIFLVSVFIGGRGWRTSSAQNFWKTKLFYGAMFSKSTIFSLLYKPYLATYLNLCSWWTWFYAQAMSILQ